MLTKKQYVLAKIQPDKAVDPVPAEASDAVTVSNISFEVLPDVIDYAHADQFMGMKSGSQQNFMLGSQISFDTEWKGEGSAVDSPPEIGGLLRACGFTETINAATSVVYAFNSKFFSDEGSEAVMIYYNQDLIRHDIGFARGTFSMTGEAGKQVTSSFVFTGFHNEAIADTQSAITVNATIPPRLVDAEFSIDAFSACIQSFSLDVGNQVVARECINSATNGIQEYGITDRIVTMTINPETPAIATKNFWEKFSDTSEMAISMRIGDTSLNRCTLTIPKAVINASPNYTDRNGILAQDISLSLKYGSGNDEITMTFD